jgi:hypothetical protein
MAVISVLLAASAVSGIVPFYVEVGFGPMLVFHFQNQHLLIAAASNPTTHTILKRSVAGLGVAHARKAPDPSLRSGFRLRAPASLTPAKPQILRFAQDFACGLPLRSRPQSGST